MRWRRLLSPTSLVYLLSSSSLLSPISPDAGEGLFDRALDPLEHLLLPLGCEVQPVVEEPAPDPRGSEAS